MNNASNESGLTAINSINQELDPIPAPGAQIEKLNKTPLRSFPGSEGYYLFAPGISKYELNEQPEPKWSAQLEMAESHAVSMAERTGWGVLVVQVVSKVIPWHQQ